MCIKPNDINSKCVRTTTTTVTRPYDKEQQQDDPRYTLTDWERESVLRLKDACDRNGVIYKSIFELAKYVLVSKSIAKDKDPKADSKRLEEALDRISKRRMWEQESGANKIMDSFEDAFQDVNEFAPNYNVFRYNRDKEDRVLVGYHFAYAPSVVVCNSTENAIKAVAVSVVKMDLAAADMEEARRGIAVVGICDGKVGIKEALNYIRMLKACKGAMQSIHPHRIRKVYVQAPTLLANMVNIARLFLPPKIRERQVLVSTIPALEKKFNMEDSSSSRRRQQDVITGMDWFHERQQLYNKTVNKLKL